MKHEQSKGASIKLMPRKHEQTTEALQLYNDPEQMHSCNVRKMTSKDWNGIGLIWIRIMLHIAIWSNIFQHKLITIKFKHNTFICIIFYYTNLFLRFDASCMFQFYEIGLIVRLLSPFNSIWKGRNYTSLKMF